MSPSQIVIAGASGFVGRELVGRLLDKFPEAKITALSRSNQKSTNTRVNWVACDLFSQDSIQEVLPDRIDVVFYLVHSMGPTAQLDQGSFADYDLIMADNFARVCHAKGCKQLIYLGGLIPAGNQLSLHLQSRLEMEEVFKGHNIPYTFFRAGLILGQHGSSFQILVKLVRRLHVMVCPTWTQTMTSPIDLKSVLAALVLAASGGEHINKTYDLAGCQPLTYLEMMKETAKFLGLKRYFVKVPLFTPTLSRLWVSLVTNTSKNLVYPLIESLQHPMVARAANVFSNDWQTRTYQDLLQGLPMRMDSKPFRLRLKFSRNTVRSIQRIPASNNSARSISEAYFSWLPQVTGHLISVFYKDNAILIRLLNQVTLIELLGGTPIAGGDGVTYAIQSGILVRKNPGARLEFRLVLDKKFVIIAIHDYAPALPWFIYKYTQALIHLLVMRAFAHFLKNNNS